MKIYKSTLWFLFIVLALTACDRPKMNTGIEVSISDQGIQQSVGLEVGDILEIVISVCTFWIAAAWVSLVMELATKV